jgi:hypothetical protein
MDLRFGSQGQDGLFHAGGAMIATHVFDCENCCFPGDFFRRHFSLLFWLILPFINRTAQNRLRTDR